MWRVVSSPRFSDTLTDVETLWSLDDLHDAIDVLDVHEELEQRASAAPQK